ncbi:MAG: type II toxin-antitoxin system VapC family toxin [Desulfobacteraceae bacterium]|nr:type II toxin-antitoxin system VapC family toxin [Desulfobacteraceae bacterium]MBC2718267.1 type II toxin-antitoxin system VapC family toxin [Desulfobacteraceae bacterium]
MILVDTDVLIEIFDRNSKKGDKALNKIERTGEDITTTYLNLHEILYGLHKYTDSAKLERILVLDVVEFTNDDAVLSSKLEVKTGKKGKKVPRFDAMIAAVAIKRGFKLFTFNRKHFEAFGDLTLV